MPKIAGTEGQIRNGPDGTLLLQNGDAQGWQTITPPPEPKNQFQELIEWIEGDISDHRGSGVQARYTLEIMLAIYESLRIKDVVNMPMETKELPLDSWFWWRCNGLPSLGIPVLEEKCPVRPVANLPFCTSNFRH